MTPKLPTPRAVVEGGALLFDDLQLGMEWRKAARTVDEAGIVLGRRGAYADR
jgi:hypothetical protein